MELQNKPLSAEELLKPRYKVINSFPFSPHYIGQVILDPADNYYSEGGTERKNYPLHTMPHLFKKLEWWMQRTIEEMPEYVKEVEDRDVFKIQEWAIIKDRMFMIFMNGDVKRNYAVVKNTMCFFEPATAQEYIEYLNQEKLK